MQQQKRRGDRKDAYLVRKVDSMHGIFPFAMPSRAANEAVMNELIDLGPVTEYIAKKNENETEFRYTFFHVICAAFAKTLYLRPKLNRFYSGYRLYERRNVSLTFTVKKQFADDAEEGMAIITLDEDSGESPISQVHEGVRKIVFGIRREHQNDGTTDAMDTLIKLPVFVLRIVFGLLKWLEAHGWYPRSLMDVDPYYASVFLSNLGSIKLHANYHHLADWGTNSIFCVVGEKKTVPFYAPDGSYTMHEALDLGLTVDERIADGYYYSRSMRLLRHLLAHPELLDLPLDTPVETEKETFRRKEHD